MWQPINTAPNDGDTIVIGWNGLEVIPMNRYESGWSDYWFDWLDPQPTHWMPLPPGPDQ